MQRADLQPAYILHQRAYRDTSAIVDVLTPEYGRVSVLAKGVKRAKSRWQGQLRAFQPMLVSWRGRSELMTLTQVEISGAHLQLPVNYLSSGLYLNELIMRLVHKAEPQIELFSDYDKAIRYISGLQPRESVSQWRLQAILRHFEINLLRHLGYEIIFSVAADANSAIQPDLDYHYQIDYGPVQLEQTLEGAENLIPVCGRTLLAMSHAQGLMSCEDPLVFRQSKRLMRAILGRHLDGKPLLSRALFVTGNTD